MYMNTITPVILETPIRALGIDPDAYGASQTTPIHIMRFVNLSQEQAATVQFMAQYNVIYCIKRNHLWNIDIHLETSKEDRYMVYFANKEIPFTLHKAYTVRPNPLFTIEYIENMPFAYSTNLKFNTLRSMPILFEFTNSTIT